MLHVPLCNHVERWRCDFSERKRELIKLLDQRSLRRPKRANHVEIVMIDDGVDCRCGAQQIVLPRCNNPARLQYSSSFQIKTVEIEPMQRLRDCDEVDCIRVDPAILR